MRHIGVRDWELYLKDPESHVEKTKCYLSHNSSFSIVCRYGELDVVKAIVERTMVDLEVRSQHGKTPLNWAAL